MKINLISTNNGVGLSVDAEILTSIFRSKGWNVTFSEFTEPPFRKSDLNIFLEMIGDYGGPHMDSALVNILIPNPEWYAPKWNQYTERMDAVWIKTDHARKPFEAIIGAGKVHKIGFTSRNMYQAGVGTIDHVFHLAGKSFAKGTKRVIEAWKQFPDIPPLTILAAPGRKFPGIGGNITLISQRLDTQDMKHIMTMHKYHLCPSETEGWGHYIVEAMSCGAVVITTDAEPMNELITPERGILCPSKGKRRTAKATSYFVPAGEIAAGVKRAISLSRPDQIRMCQAAKDWHFANDAAFRERIVGAVERIMEGVGV